MQKKSTESTKRHDELARLFGLPVSPEVTTIPSLPTLSDLMEGDPSPTSRARVQGLFSEILRDDANILYQDMRQAPEKYDPDAVELITRLIARKRELSKQERQLLDLAVLELNRQPPDKAPPKQPVTKLVVRELAVEEEPAGLPREGIDFPAGLERPFWWL